MEETPPPSPQRKRRGPKPRLGVQVSTHVLLPPELMEWAKDQPEGLSGLIRQLLAAERERREKGDAP